MVGRVLKMWTDVENEYKKIFKIASRKQIFDF